VCLDCGKQFDYDLQHMRIGKRIDPEHNNSVVPKDAPLPPAAKVKYAVLAALPVAMLLRAIRRLRKAGTHNLLGNRPAAP